MEQVFDYIRLNKHAANSLPPSGAVDLRIKASTGALIGKQSDGTDGYVATVNPYADQTAANEALAVNVLYFNVATGYFQITTE